MEAVYIDFFGNKRLVEVVIDVGENNRVIVKENGVNPFPVSWSDLVPTTLESQAREYKYDPKPIK